MRASLSENNLTFKVPIKTM